MAEPGFPTDEGLPAISPAPDASGRLQAGLVLNGTYVIDSLIATGGMGEVYRGHVLETGDMVAIKVIRADMAANEAALALFRKEASALHRLNHEAIIRYFVVAIDPGLQRPYLAMEFVDGEPLSDILKRGALPADQCHLLLDRLAAGLGAAHQIGIVHRDISPDNVIVPDGDVRRAKIIDFGIAKSMALGAATVIGDGFAGKYSYVSPEQLGLYGGAVTARSDMYSLGLLVAEAARGARLDMGANHAETIDRRRAVPVLDGVPDTLRAALTAMLQPLPEDRPESMEAVRLLRQPHAMPQAAAPAGDATVLRPVRQRGRLSALEAEIVPEPRGWARRVAAAVLIAVFLGGAGAAGWYWWPVLTQRFAGVSSTLDGDPYLPLPRPGDRQPGLPQLIPSQQAQADGELADTDGGAPARPAAQSPHPPALSPSVPEAAPPPRPAPAAMTPVPDQPAASPVPPRPSFPLQPPALPPSLPLLPPPASTPIVQPPPVVALRPDPPAMRPPPGAPEIVPPERPAPSRPDPISRPVLQPAPVSGAAAFVDGYPAQACQFFSLRSMEATKADVEAFGTGVRPVEVFDAAFKQAMGFEAQIQFRQISGAQCPAVDFLREVPGNRTATARFDLSAYSLKPGQAVDGTIQGAGLRAVTALLVTDDGLVQPVPVRTQPGTGQTVLTIAADGGSMASRRPKLVVVILSPERPKALAQRGRMAAADLFPALARELAEDRERVTVLRQFFRVDG